MGLITPESFNVSYQRLNAPNADPVEITGKKGNGEPHVIVVGGITPLQKASVEIAAAMAQGILAGGSTSQGASLDADSIADNAVRLARATLEKANLQPHPAQCGVAANSDQNDGDG